MANIKVILKEVLHDGSSVTFKAPCKCSEASGLIVEYPTIVDGTPSTGSKTFTFRDTHGNDLTGIDDLFVEGVLVQVLLDCANGYAYIQNAATNKYIEDAFSNHGKHVPTPQTANNATFLRNDNTWQKVTPANIGAAASSHGNHVPATETANNAKFLRNDNTWQTVTPANIGAAASSHNHSAANITSGTLGVARGGTGAATFTSGAALIGAGTGAVTTRAITNNTSNANLSGTNLVTANSVNYHGRYWLNRSNRVADADTNYTTYMARAVALVTSVPSSMTNGTCAFVYS